MTYVNRHQRERQATKLQILHDRKKSADLLWDLAYIRAIDGTIDRRELYKAAKFCNDTEKAIMLEENEIEEMRISRLGSHLET